MRTGSPVPQRFQVRPWQRSYPVAWAIPFPRESRTIRRVAPVPRSAFFLMRSFQPAPGRHPRRICCNIFRCPTSLARLSPPRKTDRKSTRLNSSHVEISYAVFCLKKKKKKKKNNNVKKNQTKKK